MIIWAIIVGVFIFALIGLGLHVNERYGGNFDAGVFLGIIITLLLVLETCLIFIITEKPAPFALDVYRGNTELEIKFVNGIPIDTVVVFKKEIIMKNKICTDILQSKKLTEILPLESADMHYATWTILNGEFIVSPNQGRTIEDMQEDYGNQIIPCWSLAALIGLLPNKIVMNNENYFLNFTKNNVEYKGIVTWDGQKCISTEAENLLDSCYNMIVKLKKDGNYIPVVPEKDK